MGCHRTTVYRKLRGRLRRGVHNGRETLLVPMRAVLDVLTSAKSDGPALPEIDDIRQRIAGLQLVLERYAAWSAKVADRLDIPV